MQVGAGASYIGGRTDSVAGRQIWLGTNSYYDGTNWLYSVSQPAAQYYQNDGAHIWNRAASGTAGNAITFTQAMTLDASGNLAIGDTANSAAGRLYVKGSGATSGSVAMVVRNSTPDDLFYIRNDGYMTFGVSTKMTLDASGNLLVGTTSPSGNSKGYFYADANTSHYLKVANVNAGSNAYTALAVSNNTGGVVEVGMQSSTRSTTYPAGEAWMYASSGLNLGYVGNIKFYAGSAERARIDSSGNLLVGTTSSNLSSASRGVIEVNGASTAYIGLDTGGTLRGTFYSNGSIVGLATATLPLTFGTTGGTEWGRFDTSGNLLVGTTSASLSNSNSCILNVSPNAYSVTNHANGVSSATRYAYFGYNGSEIGSITQNGTTAVAYNTSSDYRLKNTIAPMTGALAKVALLKPVTYKWNADGSDGQGFIAHELAEVVPQCVTGEKDGVNEDGTPKYQGIDTSFLVATLTAAIQELKAEFDAYKASHP